jgi:hypothetical protein
VRFLAFSSFSQKFAFQYSENQLKSLSFIPIFFVFSAFQLEKSVEKPEQT